MPKKNKSKKKSVRRPSKEQFVYLSKCHGVRATKEPLAMPADNRVGKLGSRPDADEQGLGGWRCSGCSRPTKVTRSKVEVASVAATA